MHIEGEGGVATGSDGTTIADSTATPSLHTALRVLGTAASTIKHLDVVVPPGSGNIGIDTNATVDDVLVQTASSPSSSAIGVQLEDGGVLIHSSVLMATDVIDDGVVFSGTAVRASDSRIVATTGLGMGAVGPPVATASRLTVTSSSVAVFVTSGTLNLEDSTFDTDTTDSTLHQGLLVNAGAGDTTLNANHVTLVGSSVSGVIAFESFATGGHRADLTVRNSVATLYPNAFERHASGGGTANITTDYSNYGGASAQDIGPGSIIETHHLNVAPGFLSATDYHLRADSPLVDAGDPAGLASGESATDASGQQRITDGDGNCSARRDIGAYEFQPGPRAPHAAASAAPALVLTGQLVNFDSAGSCDADGDALSFSWTFDDGGGAPGASVQRTFSSPGLHFGTVTVSDSTGRFASATAAVRVVFPPFAGVGIAKAKVRATKKGALKVKVSCPAGTTGFCAGSLTLDGAKSTFTLAPGRSKSLPLKLSRARLRTLRKKKSQKLTATASAHDANGTAKTSTAKLTLLAPR